MTGLLTGENRSSRRKICPISRWIALGSNPGLCGDRPVINRQGHRTALAQNMFKMDSKLTIILCVTFYIHVRPVICVTCVTNVNCVVVSTAPVLTSIQFYMCNIRLIMSPWQAPSNARTLSGRAAPCRPPPDRRPVVRPAAPTPHRLRSASPLASSWQPVIKGSPYHNQPSLCVVSPIYVTSLVFTYRALINIKIKHINGWEFEITFSWQEKQSFC